MSTKSFFKAETWVALCASAASALALAVTPAVSQAEAVHIHFGDLDLSTPSGAAAFSQRIDKASNVFCASSGADMAARRACKEAIREEALSKLAESQRVALAAAPSMAKHQARANAAGF